LRQAQENLLQNLKKRSFRKISQFKVIPSQAFFSKGVKKNTVNLNRRQTAKIIERGIIQITHHPIQGVLGFLKTIEGSSSQSLLQPGIGRRGPTSPKFLYILEEATFPIPFPAAAETGLI
jgi:hypothetical protein